MFFLVEMRLRKNRRPRADSIKVNRFALCESSWQRRSLHLERRLNLRAIFSSRRRRAEKSIARGDMNATFGFLPHEIGEANDPIVVTRFYDQSRENPGQSRQPFPFQDHRLRPNRLTLERFEIWVLDRFAS